MEATVADIIYDSVYGDATDSAPTSPISEWFEYDLTRVPAGTTQIDHNTYVAEVTALDILRTLSDGKHSASVHHCLFSPPTLMQRQWDLALLGLLLFVRSSPTISRTDHGDQSSGPRSLQADAFISSCGYSK